MDTKNPSFPPTSSHSKITPRIIIHGGAGNLTRRTIPRDRYDAYQASLLRILASSHALLSEPGSTALDVATYAVSLLENDPLFNSGKGAVFTRAGRNELECSIMISNGYRKRGVGLMMIQHVKNPIKLAREVLIRGEQEDGGGAKDHCEYSGAFIEQLGQKWGIDMCDSDYYFTQQRWDEHVRGLQEEQKMGALAHDAGAVSDWERENYIPLGTCGAVVLDGLGTICAATSTGGLTNKVPGRVGDTPTMGAGYWAEEWFDDMAASGPTRMLYRPQTPPPLDKLSRGDVRGLVADCLPSFAGSQSAPTQEFASCVRDEKCTSVRHAVGLSGTGNGDSFLRLSAARTAAAKSRFASTSLASATTWMSGPGGELQKSAGNRWELGHEGVGGLIGIELVGEKSSVVHDFNCGGMFRAWAEEDGELRCRIFKGGGWESGPEGFGGSC